MRDDEYKTIAGNSEGSYKEKGSKFLAFAFPVDHTEDVKTKLEYLRKKYHDARHHCYAYRLGIKPEEFRYNDDGEPSGTAGKPIYGQIVSNGLTNILIVVVRYFGGIKLGTGGLIRAYKAAAKDAIERAALVQKTVTEEIHLSFPYERLNDIMKIIKEEDLAIQRQDFRERCEIVVLIRRSEKNKLSERTSAYGDVFFL